MRGHKLPLEVIICSAVFPPEVPRARTGHESFSVEFFFRVSAFLTFSLASFLVQASLEDYEETVKKAKEAWKVWADVS